MRMRASTMPTGKRGSNAPRSSWVTEAPPTFRNQGGASHRGRKASCEVKTPAGSACESTRSKSQLLERLESQRSHRRGGASHRANQVAGVSMKNTELDVVDESTTKSPSMQLACAHIDADCESAFEAYKRASMAGADAGPSAGPQQQQSNEASISTVTASTDAVAAHSPCAFTLSDEAGCDSAFEAYKRVSMAGAIAGTSHSPQQPPSSEAPALAAADAPAPLAILTAAPAEAAAPAAAATPSLNGDVGQSTLRDAAGCNSAFEAYLVASGATSVADAISDPQQLPSNEALTGSDTACEAAFDESIFPITSVITQEWYAVMARPLSVTMFGWGTFSHSHTCWIPLTTSYT